MRNYDVILFDLDGTLTDSAPGILNSVRYACRKLGLPIPGEETLRRFLGPPLIASFRELAGRRRRRPRRQRLSGVFPHEGPV